MCKCLEHMLLYQSNRFHRIGRTVMDHCTDQLQSVHSWGLGSEMLTRAAPPVAVEVEAEEVDVVFVVVDAVVVALELVDVVVFPVVVAPTAVVVLPPVAVLPPGGEVVGTVEGCNEVFHVAVVG